MFCQKAVLRFPGPNIANIVTTVGVPGAPDFGSSARIDSASTAIGKIVKPDPLGSSWADCAQRLVIPPINNVLPTAISIAPDSALSCCDIWVGGDSDIQRFRVSPGNPCVANLEKSGFVFVTLPYSVPAIPADASGRSVWDAISINTTFGNNCWGFPLRLLVWYGEAPNGLSLNRAPYYAYHTFNITTATTINWYYIVEGRRRASFRFLRASANQTFTFSAIESIIGPQPLANNEFQFLTPLGAFAAAAASNLIDQIDVTFNTPTMAVLVSVADSVGSAGLIGRMRCIAVDDANN